MGQLLGQLSKPGTPWLDKVQLFGALGEVLQNAGSGGPCAEVASNSDRVAACLLDGIGAMPAVICDTEGVPPFFCPAQHCMHACAKALPLQWCICWS